ncbi:Hypothetical protein ADU72_0863 [Pediococcus damnosus]|uniref:IpaB/EvcA family protein n=1 Tax=Pediococcus damnosus TaxID=51663 RepID=A0ABN4N8F3_9LACO|nr:hypothetical protein [Pediococcus damnosus]AMV60689.1 Hypothetical protein ADU69_1028 [Pediococcus damnosus]AMV66808.1 Hypothetical protein ADU72_0863 [Pediococcus damnosus]KJU73347.1 IpaB/EvcA family protein [Pediococcus damnosus LMG 28219]KRN45646.1 hypothetical protein IV84_GL000135 [Pediococcus damnosus]PIO81533.1 hypothetical protein BSQ38_07680 [Pediococcus damnosus]
MSEERLNAEVTTLFDRIDAMIPEQLTVQYGDQKSGYVRYDQSYQTVENGQLIIHVQDVTAPNYTVSHELLHKLMEIKKYPQIQFQLTSGNREFDEQLMIITTALYDTVLHLNIYNWQRQHGLLTEAVQADYLAGIVKTITPEQGDKLDSMMHLRLMTILDALVFYGDDIDQVAAQFKRDYPITLTVVQKLYNLITEKPVNSPFAVRRTVVSLFAEFDKQLKSLDLPTLGSSEFVTLESVMSQRQLRLEVRQLFQIAHSEIQDAKTQKRAYIGLGVQDQQNAFVLPMPPKSKTEEYFKTLYGLSVKELFEQMQIPYLIR